VRLRPLDIVVDKALMGLGLGTAGEALVVALSGGADSVALADALATVAARRGFRLVAAHLDHGLRPDSGEDVVFCADLARRLGISIHQGRADVRGRARSDKAGLEDAARRERHAFLRAVQKAEGAAAIVLAHTRDDQAETLLLRLLRGAGSTGLAAMRPRAGDVVRPLLGVSRADVLAHLAERGLTWREDATNADPAFLRNRVRHELIPYLESRFNPRIRAGLARQAGLLADEDQTLEAEAEHLAETIVRSDDDGIILFRAGLRAAPRALARRVVRQALARAGGLPGVSAHHVERLLDLAASDRPSGRSLALPGGRTAHFRFDHVHLGPSPRPAGAFAYPLDVPGRVELPHGFALEVLAASGPAPSPAEAGHEGRTAVVAAPRDAALLVRTRRPGDRVSWHGREVSLKRFLIERRVPADERPGLPLLAAGSRVLWVPGQPVEGRAGDRWLGLRFLSPEAR
jgi:tRNA(Ile)-lysidine synthase